MYACVIPAQNAGSIFCVKTIMNWHALRLQWVHIQISSTKKSMSMKYETLPSDYRIINISHDKTFRHQFPLNNNLSKLNTYYMNHWSLCDEWYLFKIFYDSIIFYHPLNGLIMEKVGVIHASHPHANTMTFSL